ncbi:dienelactone hydrolase family protein [Streptomyces sp. SID3343]|uniref:dienelactone hydrolase family protein n=1 Tax=Streptomyces sp. SID3343 TaxID=2690260 RepID=UPI00136A2368|nr:dienelactone hydrolase family protein [Streptomyces sp. SID3343]MYW02734.1 dienelactone hydrolase family protein [Streptomyces sp. SID3343]
MGGADVHGRGEAGGEGPVSGVERDAAVGIVTEWIDVDVAGEAAPMSAYLARPVGPGPYPNVLVGFEMFGVTGYVRGVAERLARLGYRALVPDFNHRQGTRIELSADDVGRARGFELVGAWERDAVRRDVMGAITALGRRFGEAPTAMLGLSAGGHLAYYAATQVPLAALVAFYPGWLTSADFALGGPEPIVELTASIAAQGTPVLVLIGEADHLYTAAERDSIGRELKEAGARHEVIVYPDTPHGFFCDERDSYRPEQAADAWSRATALLARTLR